MIITANTYKELYIRKKITNILFSNHDYIFPDFLWTI